MTRLPDGPPTAFRLTVPARFDGREHHRGRHTLHVAGGTIGADGDPDAPHLDLSDRDVTLLPGLIDAHVHLAISDTDPAERALPQGLRALRMARNARAQLRAGVTTVRDLGAPDGLDRQLRRAIDEGLVVGPRMLVAGRPAGRRRRLSPTDALRAATGTAAGVLGRGDLGSLATGSTADLVVVRGERLAATLGEVVLVVVGGRVLRAHPSLGWRAAGALDGSDG